MVKGILEKEIGLESYFDRIKNEIEFIFYKIFQHANNIRAKSIYKGAELEKLDKIDRVFIETYRVEWKSVDGILYGKVDGVAETFLKIKIQESKRRGEVIVNIKILEPKYSFALTKIVAQFSELKRAVSTKNWPKAEAIIKAYIAKKLHKDNSMDLEFRYSKSSFNKFIEYSTFEIRRKLFYDFVKEVFSVLGISIPTVGVKRITPDIESSEHLLNIQSRFVMQNNYFYNCVELYLPEDLDRGILPTLNVVNSNYTHNSVSSVNSQIVYFNTQHTPILTSSFIYPDYRPTDVIITFHQFNHSKEVFDNGLVLSIPVSLIEGIDIVYAEKRKKYKNVNILGYTKKLLIPSRGQLRVYTKLGKIVLPLYDNRSFTDANNPDSVFYFKNQYYTGVFDYIKTIDYIKQLLEDDEEE